MIIILILHLILNLANTPNRPKSASHQHAPQHHEAVTGDRLYLIFLFKNSSRCKRGAGTLRCKTHSFPPEPESRHSLGKRPNTQRRVCRTLQDEVMLPSGGRKSEWGQIFVGVFDTYFHITRTQWHQCWPSNNCFSLLVTDSFGPWCIMGLLEHSSYTALLVLVQTSFSTGSSRSGVGKL